MGEYALRAQNLRDRYVKRHGGTISTGGLPVVNVKYDHDLNALFSKVVPLHPTHGVPALLSIMGGMFTDATGMARNNAHTWSDVQALALNDGWEMMNHFWSHRDVQSSAELYHEIVDPLAVYRAENA